MCSEPKQIGWFPKEREAHLETSLDMHVQGASGSQYCWSEKCEGGHICQKCIVYCQCYSRALAPNRKYTWIFQDSLKYQQEEEDHVYRV